MSQTQSFVTTFMATLAGKDAALNQSLVDIFSKILINKVSVDAEGVVTPSNSFDTLAQVFTFVATPAANRDGGPLSYSKDAITAATAAGKVAAGETPPDLPTEAPTEAPVEIDGKTQMLTKGLDNLTGTDKNDLFVGSMDKDNVELNTMSAIDMIDGGKGIDTLQVSTTKTMTQADLPDIKNVEILTINSSAVDNTTDSILAIKLDTTAIVGLTNLNVTRALGTTELKTANTTNVSVSDVTKAITVEGGKNVVVNDKTAANNITITKAAGTITVTDTDNSDKTAITNNAITIKNGTDVTVTTSADAKDLSAASFTGNITIGGTTTAADQATGNVVVTQNTKSDASKAVTAGAITVEGGKTIDITANLEINAAKLTTGTLTAGKIVAKAGTTTTDITVKQNSVANDYAAEITTAAATESSVITFGSLKKGESVVIGDTATNLVVQTDLTFTANKDLTAAEVAAAVANLTNLDKQAAGGPLTNGTFTGALDTGWTSGAVNGASVTFTATTAGNKTNDFRVETDAGSTAGNASNNAVKKADFKTVTTQGINEVKTSAVDVTADYGVVEVTATAATTTVTVDGYADASKIDASTALSTLNLSNAEGTATMTVAAAAAALDLTVEKLGTALVASSEGVAEVPEVISVLTLSNAPKTLNVTSTGNNVVKLTAAATEVLNVKGTGLFDVDSIDLATLKTVVVTETAGLSLHADVEDTVTSVDTTATTGTVTVAIDSTKATYAGGEGNDIVTLSNTTAATKAIDLGNGNNTLILADDTVTAPTVDIKAGTGIDTISMNSVSAEFSNGLSASKNFANKMIGFDRLLINNLVDTQTAAVTIKLDNLGFSYVTTSGVTDGTNKLTLDKMANKGTVELTNVQAGAAGIEVKVIDADTVDATLNVLVTNSLAEETPLNAGLLTVADVENINITTTDMTPWKANGTADINLNTLELAADKAKVVTIDGNSDFKLLTGTTENAALTTVNATAMTGKLTVDLSGQAGVAVTVNAGSGKDTLTASVGTAASADVLNGGAGDDTLTAGSNGAKLTGGAGNDTFILTATSDVLGTNEATTHSYITDFSAGDVLKLGYYDTSSTTVAVVESFAKLTAVQSANATYGDYAKAAIAQADLGDAVWFSFAGNSYVVIDSDAAGTEFENTKDLAIELTGVANLDNASFNATHGTVEIA